MPRSRTKIGEGHETNEINNWKHRFMQAQVLSHLVESAIYRYSYVTKEHFSPKINEAGEEKIATSYDCLSRFYCGHERLSV